MNQKLSIGPSLARKEPNDDASVQDIVQAIMKKRMVATEPELEETLEDEALEPTDMPEEPIDPRATLKAKLSEIMAGMRAAKFK